MYVGSYKLHVAFSFKIAKIYFFVKPLFWKSKSTNRLHFWRRLRISISFWLNRKKEVVMSHNDFFLIFGHNLWPKIFKSKSYYMYYSTVCYHISTGLSPCTNRPINCKACNNFFWSYNIESHYKVDHLSLVVSSSPHTKLFLFCTCYLLKSIQNMFQYKFKFVLCKKFRY